MASHLNHSEPRTAAIGPPQFGLRALFVGITVCGVLFALMSVLGLFWSAGLLLLLSLVGAHVIGNALGTRLRDGAPQAARRAEPRQAYDATRPHVAPARRLQENTRVHRWLLVVAALGAIAGGTIGALVLLEVLGEHTSLPALALGIGSAAVLGGLFAFLLSSFFLVFLRAWSEALVDPSRTSPPRGRG